MKMSGRGFDIERVINDLPEDIKQNSQIDEKLEQLKNTPGFEQKKQIIDSIKHEIDSFMDTLSDDTEKQKLIELKKQLDTFKTSLDSLKQQVKNNPDISKVKIFEVTEQMEEEGLFGKDDVGIGGWFRKIIKWFEEFLGGFGISKASSIDNIAKTFEKLGYGKDEKIIEKVLKVVRKIPLDKLEEKIKDLDFEKLEPKNDDDSLWDKFLKLPIVKVIVDFVNEHLGNDEKITTLEEKKVAFRILKTVVLNKDIVSNNESSNLFSKIKSKLTNSVKGSLGIKNNNGNITVGKVLDKMFDHGVSDNLRNYALPEDGVKLLDFRKTNNNETNQSNNVDVKKISETVYKIGDSKIEINGNKFFIEKGGKQYQVIKIMNFGEKDIKELQFVSNGLKINIKGVEKIVRFDRLKELIDNIGPSKTKLDIDGVEIEFKIVS